MSKELIKGKLTGIIVDELGIDEADISYTSNQQFTKDLGADSLDEVGLLMAVQKEFDLWISDEEAQKLTTPKLALDYLVKKFKS